MNNNQGYWNIQTPQRQQFQRFSPDNRNNYTNVQSSKRQYNEDLYKVAGFSFPNNNLLLVALMKRVVKATEKNDKETYIAFVTTVLGVGNGNNRTYDFSQKVVQKFSLRELKSLSFAIKQLAQNNISILPYSKFTNSGDGSKTLYLNFHSRNESNTNNGQDIIVIGASWNKLKINLNFSKYDAYGVADSIEQLYNLGMHLELTEQSKRNYSNSDFHNGSYNNSNIIPNNLNNSNNIPLPSLNNLPNQRLPNNQMSNGQMMSVKSQQSQQPLASSNKQKVINANNAASVLADFAKMVSS